MAVTPELTSREWEQLEDAVMVFMDAITGNFPGADLTRLQVLLAKINQFTGSYLPSGALSHDLP